MTIESKMTIMKISYLQLEDYKSLKLIKNILK